MAPWATAADVDACQCCEGKNGADVEPWLGIASDVLFLLSGSQFGGIVEQMVRPSSAMVHASPAISSILNSMTWQQWDGCGCGWLPEYDGRTCDATPVIDLGFYPLLTVTNVTIDGVSLGTSNLRIDDDRYLIREDGIAWPCCQSLGKAAGQVGTWSVSVTHGTEIPDLGPKAVMALACELAKCPGSDCGLSDRVTQLAKQGVTEIMGDKAQLLNDDILGIRAVDLFLRVYNPGRLAEASVVVSPDQPPRSTTTTWSG